MKSTGELDIDVVYVHVSPCFLTCVHIGELTRSGPEAPDIVEHRNELIHHCMTWTVRHHTRSGAASNLFKPVIADAGRAVAAAQGKSHSVLAMHLHLEKFQHWAPVMFVLTRLQDELGSVKTPSNVFVLIAQASHSHVMTLHTSWLAPLLSCR